MENNYLRDKFDKVIEILQYRHECNTTDGLEWTFESLANLPNEKLDKKIKFLKEAFGEGCTCDREVKFEDFIKLLMPKKHIKL